MTNVRNKRTIVRYMRTKKKKPIDWLFPEVRSKTLALLLDDPGKRWYLRDMERRTGLGVSTVRRELTGLTEAEIISKTLDGNRTYYQANRECPFLQDLCALLRKTTGVIEILKRSLEPLSTKIQVACVYGSFGQGTAHSGSDVDFLVIGSCRSVDMVDAISDTQEKTGREINATVYSVKEWQAKRSAKNHFVCSVSDSPHKIFLIGTQDDLERLNQ